MSLDAFIADAVRRAELKKLKPRAKAVPKDDAYRRTKEELRKMQLDACIPKSIHLRITYQDCECGASYESVNQTPLVLCVGKNLKHYEPHEAIHGDEYAPLPRYMEIRHVNIPYCPDCFANAHTVEVKDEPL